MIGNTVGYVRTEPSELVAELRDLIVVNRINIAIAVLNILEYVITLRQEVEKIWKRRWFLATWIFLVNRYLAILYAMVIMTMLVIQTMDVCAVLLDILSTTLLLQSLVLAGESFLLFFSSLRVWALWHGSPKWPIVVFVLTFIPVATDIFNYQSIRPRAPFEFFGCSSQASISKADIFWIGVCNRLCVIAADAVVLVSTWKKTFATRQESIRLGLRLPTVQLVFRDGTTYFFASFLLNLAQFLTVLLSTFSSVSPISESSHWQALIPILISRFLLDLRNIDEEEESGPGLTPTRSHIRWNRYPTAIMGNLGASLRSPFDYTDDECSATESVDVLAVDHAATRREYDFELNDLERRTVSGLPVLEISIPRTATDTTVS